MKLLNKSYLFSGLAIIAQLVRHVNGRSHGHSTEGISNAVELCRPPCQSNQLQKLSQGRVLQMQAVLVEFCKQELTTCTLRMINTIRHQDYGCLATMR